MQGTIYSYGHLISKPLAPKKYKKQV